MSLIVNFNQTPETLENTRMAKPSRPQNANVKDKSYMAVGNRKPQDVSTILGFLLFCSFYSSKNSSSKIMTALPDCGTASLPWEVTMSCLLSGESAMPTGKASALTS